MKYYKFRHRRSDNNGSNNNKRGKRKQFKEY